MIKKLLIALALAIFPITAIAGASEEEWKEAFAGEGGRIETKLNPRTKIVEVVPGGKEKFSHIRLRILRKDKRPLELRLHAVEPTESPVRYQGKLSDWSGSMMGLEVEVSFDGRSWKRIGRMIKKILP